MASQVALTWLVGPSSVNFFFSTPLTSRYKSRKSVARPLFKGRLSNLKGFDKKNKKKRNKMWLTITLRK